MNKGCDCVTKEQEPVRESGEVRQELSMLEERLEGLHVKLEKLNCLIKPILSHQESGDQGCDSRDSCTELGVYINSLRVRLETANEYLNNILSRIEL